MPRKGRWRWHVTPAQKWREMQDALERERLLPFDEERDRLDEALECYPIGNLV